MCLCVFDLYATNLVLRVTALLTCMFFGSCVARCEPPTTLVKSEKSGPLDTDNDGLTDEVRWCVMVVYTYVSAYVCMYACVCIYTYVCIHMFSICMHMCVCVFVFSTTITCVIDNLTITSVHCAPKATLAHNAISNTITCVIYIYSCTPHWHLMPFWFPCRKRESLSEYTSFVRYEYQAEKFKLQTPGWIR
jgi:hypothetical protein